MVELSYYDGRTRYCPRLGHAVPFGYCRKPGSDTLCRNIVGCWESHLDIHGFLETHAAEEEIRALRADPKPKMTSLLELIQQAKVRKDS
jgi:hypothetical protein